MKWLFVVGLTVGCHTGKVESEAGTPPVGSSAPLASASAAPAPVRAADGSVAMTWIGPGQLEIEGNGSFSSALRIERRAADGTWSTLEQADPFRLRARCEDPEPAQCTDLSQGKALRPAHWNGLALNSQCGLGAKGTSGDVAGHVRFVLTSCDGVHQTLSPELDVWVDADVAERAWAAQSITAVKAMRLEGPIANWQTTDLPVPGRLMGLPVRAGTEHVLDEAQRKRLSELLADRAGYNDQIRKRCLMKHMLGFSITRSLPTSAASSTRSQEIEVVMDLSCHKIFVGRGDLAPRSIHGSHFDALRAGYLELVKGVFATDRELAVLK